MRNGLRVAFAFAAAACSSSGSSSPTAGDAGAAAEPPDAGEFSPFPDEATFDCNAPLASGALTPAVPVDYLETRTYDQYAGPDAGTAVPAPGSTGTPCSSEACRDALVHASRFDGWHASDSCASETTPSFLVYSRGENAGTVGARDVAAFLAPIDSLAEANLVLLASKSIPFICMTTHAKAGWRKNADGSFELITVYDSGCSFAKRGRYRVDPSGAVTVIAEDVARH